MPFVKGQSGNPLGGRRKTRQQIEFEQKCRDWSAMYAFDRLRSWTSSKDPKVAQWALSEMINRAFGKAEQPSYVEANVTADLGSSAQELAREAAELIGGAAGEGCPIVPANTVDPGK